MQKQGTIANGDTITGSATGATGTVIDIASVTDNILGSPPKLYSNRYTCIPTPALIQLQMAQQQQHLI